MTDSVKLSAFSERPIEDLVSGISALQVQLGARARVAARGPFQAPLPPAADRTRPPRLGEEVEHVGAAEEADHLAAPYDRHAADSFADEQPRRLVDPGLLGDGDDARAHDVARDLSLLGEDVRLGNDADDVTLVGDDRRTRDALRQERGGDLVHRCVFAKRDHVSCHHFFDGDHQVPSSVATVCRLALPPLRIRPVRPFGSLPDRWAASASAPVGSSARWRRVHATRAALAISSSVTVTISSTSRLANITSKLRAPMANVMPSWMTSAPKARVAATLAGFASSGMRINAGSPTVAAASATACAWLPELTAMTPFGRSPASSSDSTALNAPRGLNEPVTWKHSGLSLRLGSRSVVSVGVRRRCSRIRPEASRTCSTCWARYSVKPRPSPALRQARDGASVAGSRAGCPRGSRSCRRRSSRSRSRGAEGRPRTRR